MAYDSVRERVVLFGGWGARFLSNETWIFDPANETWEEVPTLQAPRPRVWADMAFDPGTGVVVLFGGRTEYGLSSETWTFDVGERRWSQRGPPGAPSSRELHRMVYDPVRQEVLLYGGWTGTDTADMFAYDAVADRWKEITPAESPPPRHGHMLAMDPLAEKAVLFGGAVTETRLNDTWIYDASLGEWTSVTSPGPSRRDRGVMVHDHRADRALLFGGLTATGSSNETWEYRLATTEWIRRTPTTSPEGLHDPAMAFDSGTGQTLLFGGSTDRRLSSETWRWASSENAWENPSPAPAPRTGHTMAYHEAVLRVVLFGGWVGGERTNETWLYDPAEDTWTEQFPDPAPPGRTHSALVYDPSIERMVLFGGATDAAPYGDGDTWAYDLVNNTWTNLTPVNRPPRVSTHAMVYDRAVQRTVLFGGWNPEIDGRLNETWHYDSASNTWTNVTPVHSPPPMAGHGMAYDEGVGRTVVYRGQLGTWTYDSAENRWREMAPSSAPPGIDFFEMVYDSEVDRVVLFGGRTPTSEHNQTWAYDARNDTWTEMRPPEAPPRRVNHALAYDRAHGVVVLFGGSTLEGARGDLWWYRMARPPDPPRNLQATVGTERVELAWEAPSKDGGASVTGYRVYRGTGSGPLASLTLVTAGEAYTDVKVAGGVTYRYRVAAINAAGEGDPSAEADATLPPPPDTVPPTVEIVAPADGATLPPGTVTVRGTAADDEVVSHVEVRVNGEDWLLAEGSTSWSLEVVLQEGPNLIQARAVDGAGNAATTNVIVTVVAEDVPLLALSLLVTVAATVILASWAFLRRRWQRGV